MTDLAVAHPSGRERRPAAAPPTRRRDGGWVTLSVAIAYLGISLFANAGTWRHGVTHTVQLGGADVPEEIWFLAQTPWALLHGHNPLANNFLNAPSGINLMDNTTMPLLGALGTPITLLFGPIATFNVMVNLALASSAMTFYLMARRFIRWRPAAFVGGLLYGFSPFVAAEGGAHLFLIVGFLPPLVVLLLDRFFRTKSDPPWLTGILVGGCFVAQLYVSAEVFASMAVMAAIAAALWIIYWLLRRPAVDIPRLARWARVRAAGIRAGQRIRGLDGTGRSRTHHWSRAEPDRDRRSVERPGGPHRPHGGPTLHLRTRHLG